MDNKRVAITAAAYLLVGAMVLLPTAFLWDALHDLEYAKKTIGANKSTEEILKGIKIRKVSVDEWSVVHLKSRDNSMEVIAFITE